MAIKAYLFSLPPVNAPKKPNHLAFPFNVRLGLAGWNAIYFTPGEFKPDPAKSAQLNRGAYLVEGLGHCGDCHTPKNIAEAPISSQAFAGEPIQHWFAPNISSDVREGIGGWSDDELVTFLKTGVAQGKGVVAGPMAETIHDSLSQMTDADLHAIVAYLKSTPAQDVKLADTKPSALQGPHGIGSGTYLTYCASCHQTTGEGIKGAVPALVGNLAVRAKGPEDVVRVILGGLPAQQGYSPMPALGADMTDQQIADVTNYVRNAWSNAAPATAGPGLVGTIRADTHTLLAGTAPDGCGTLVQPKLKAAVDDPKDGIADLLHQINSGNITEEIAQLVPKVHAAAPGVSQADIINGMTVAYCPIVSRDGGLAKPENRRLLNRFTTLLYTKLVGGSS
jgi:mono/diheme cytochrome c family protein